MHQFHNARSHGWSFYAKIISPVLILNTLCFIVKLDISLVMMANAFLILLTFALVRLKPEKSKLPFISIQDSKLEYFCPHKKEIITVHAHEITNITTRFCELRIHTNDCLHSINLELIPKERTRWEIKEMIRQLAPLNPEVRLADSD